MSFDLILLLAAIFAGATLQVGVGIGFSIVVAPIMMLMLGTATAVPVLLMLNTLVSALALERRLWVQEKALIGKAIVGCLVGILLGLLVYSYLSERAVLVLTASILLVGVVASLLPVASQLGARGFNLISGVSGLATVWAATPGPLMVLGFLALGRSADEVRKLVQPVALVAYGVAFILRGFADWTSVSEAPWLLEFGIATIAGSLLGRLIGPKLPRFVIISGIRLISALACIVLFYRAFKLGA